MDTIVACTTPWGRGAVAVVRLSGPGAHALAQRLCPEGPRWQPRRQSLRTLRGPEGPVDQVLVSWMPGPHSYTGEDVVELSCHGNPVIVEQVIDLFVHAGARLARPGEFTRRAVEHGRLDLVQAEAVAGLVAARSPAGVAVARAGLDGALSEVLQGLREHLLDLAAELELRLDHPGEDLGEAEDAAVVAALQALAQQATALAATWRAGQVRLEGARIALVGPVNAGKSSLFNRLLGTERALVSAEPGTTRDAVEKSLLVDGVELVLLDTAGERADAEGLEAAGIALGRSLSADVALQVLVLPLDRPLDPAGAALLAHPRSVPRLLVGTHADHPACAAALPPGCAPDHVVSNTTGAGVPALRAALRAAVDSSAADGARAMVFSQRQHALLGALGGHAAAAAEALAGELGVAVAAEELTRGLARLDALTGADTREAVLDRLFARFCVGK